MSKLIFSERLIQLMEKAGVRQEDLAVATGVSQGAVSRWLSGSIPRSDKIWLIAKKLGVRVEDLVGVQINADMSRASVVIREEPQPYGASVELLAARLAGQAASFASESNAARRMRWQQLEQEFNSLKTAWELQVEKGRAIRAAQAKGERNQ